MNDTNKAATTEQPRFSIVISAHDQADDLKQSLPLLLEQEYEGYELIVVNESSTDDTDDVLKSMKARYSHLYTTFIPKDSRYENRQKLGLTLGVKAARNEWVIFINAAIFPPSQQWLSQISELLNGDELMLGYITQKNHSFRLQSFSNLTEARKYISKAERRKSDGHQGKMLRYINGKYDFIVVSHGKGHEILSYFGERLSWLKLNTQRMKVFSYNLFH
jgi:glycosyltransferase involved in cell wall biosynthesis